MKQNDTLLASLGIVLVLLLLGYGLYYATPPAASVDSRAQSLLSTQEKKSINTSILSNKTVDEIRSYKEFGEHPVTVDKSDINRANPFEGI